MEKQEQNNSDQSYIKITRGQRGSVGWDIKVVGEDMKRIVKELKIIDEDLSSAFKNINSGKEQ